ANFLGENPRFATSALRRFTQHDFIKRVDRAGIAWHEKTLGQLFCDDSAKQIVRMLTDDMAAAGVTLKMKTGVERLTKSGEDWSVDLSDRTQVTATALVVATGGKSIPKMGATGWAYEVARQFDIRVTDIRPALVPLTFEAGLLETLTPLAGVAVDARVASAPDTKARKAAFDEAMLFTHRGLSGPAILQISSYWREGEAIVATMAPGRDVFAELKAAKTANGRQAVHTALGHVVPRRLAESLCAREGAAGNLADLSDATLRRLDQAVNAWSVKPVGSEGYRTAEVTLGGIDTAALDQQTLAAKAVPGLYFIGEAVDVTGWLGGYNFQWAWSSGWAAGQVC
ncbi:MAG: NAD(P)/FAD-dependent oxidoreductase, partial [Brevundimonas sp.]